MRNHFWILAGIFWHNGKFPWEMECLLNPFHFFGGVYISHHFPSDFHSSWDFLPAAVACRAGQIHTERRAPFVGHPSDLSGLSSISWDINGHQFRQTSTCPWFFLYSIHRHGVLIREITTEMSGSYGISMYIWSAGMWHLMHKLRSSQIIGLL